MAKEKGDLSLHNNHHDRSFVINNEIKIVYHWSKFCTDITKTSGYA